MLKLRHVGIVVDDLVKAAEWYERFNYFPLLYETVEIAGRAVQLCKLVHIDGSMIELLDGATAVPHISVTVNPLEFEKMKADDAGLFEKDGVIYIRDPFGNIVEIVNETD